MQAGQVAVQDEDVVLAEAQAPQGLQAVARLVDGERVAAQPLGDHLPEEFLVLHHQYAHGVLFTGDRHFAVVSRVREGSERPFPRRLGPMKRSLIMTTAAVVTGLTLFATACANDSPTGKKDSSGGGGGSSETVADNAVKMRQCLREHGIDVPDPEPGQDPRGMTLGGDADPQKMQEAMKACRMSTGSGAARSPRRRRRTGNWSGSGACARTGSPSRTLSTTEA